MSEYIDDDFDFEHMALADLEKILDVPFVLWFCPKGCRKGVTWTTHPDGSMTARCDACGEVSQPYNAKAPSASPDAEGAAPGG